MGAEIIEKRPKSAKKKKPKRSKSPAKERPEDVVAAVAAANDDAEMEDVAKESLDGGDGDVKKTDVVKSAKKKAKNSHKSKASKDEPVDTAAASTAAADDDAPEAEAEDSTVPNDHAAEDGGDGASGDGDGEGDEKKDDEVVDDRERRRQEKAAKRAAKKSEKSSLLDKVPTHDADGILYTKLQIRRMAKRVKRGLNPVPTEAEENERRRQDKIDRQLTEDDLAGSGDEDEEDDNEEGADEKEEAGEGQSTVEGDKDGGDVDPFAKDDSDEDAEDDAPPKAPLDFFKKNRRSKPVPSDYSCSACHNKNDLPPHWIYDCPYKVRKPGYREVSTKKRSSGRPDSQKVFVSGLPFEAREADVRRFFEEKVDDKLVECKLLTFDDSNRCKGQAFVTFDSDEGGKKALELTGSIWNSFDAKTEAPTSKKQLRLQIMKIRDQKGKTKKNNRAAKRARKFKDTNVKDTNVEKVTVAPDKAPDNED